MITAIIQARANSNRLPNKIFSEIEGFPLLWHVVNRLRKSTMVSRIIVATTETAVDNKVVDWCNNNRVDFFRGSENNVLERFYQAAKLYKADYIARITADDPFKDPEIIDAVAKLLINNNLDFAYNNSPPTFPEGLDTEIFTFSALEKAYTNSEDPFEKEHLTQYFYRHPDDFVQKNFSYKEDISNLRWTIDRLEDLEMVKVIYKKLFPQKNVFLLNDILDLLKLEPWIIELNTKVERSAMYKNLRSYEENH